MFSRDEHHAVGCNSKGIMASMVKLSNHKISPLTLIPLSPVLPSPSANQADLELKTCSC